MSCYLKKKNLKIFTNITFKQGVELVVMAFNYTKQANPL